MMMMTSCPGEGNGARLGAQEGARTPPLTHALPPSNMIKGYYTMAGKKPELSHTLTLFSGQSYALPLLNLDELCSSTSGVQQGLASTEMPHYCEGEEDAKVMRFVSLGSVFQAN